MKKKVDKINLQQFIIDSQNIRNKEKILEEFKADKYGNITLEQSKLLLEKYPTSKSEELSDDISDSETESIQEVELDNGKIIDSCNSLFNYKGNKFMYIVCEEQVYFKGKEIAQFLDYNDTKKAIVNNVSEKYKITFGKINEILVKNRGENFSPRAYNTKLTPNEKNTIFISEFGLYQLIMKSRKEEAVKFQDFVYEKVLPSLRKTGTFSIAPKVSLDTSLITSFYEENDISDFHEANVVYLMVIGMYESGLLVKFGKSSRIFQREHKEHKRDYGDQIKIVLVLNTDNNDKVEIAFSQSVEAKGLSRKLVFNGKSRDELFVTNEKFKLADVIDLMKKICNQHPLPAIKECKNEIKELKFQLDTNISIEQERTKQKELETKQKQYEAETRQKELEEETKRKELDMKLQIKLRELEIQEKISTKKLEILNGNKQQKISVKNEIRTNEDKTSEIGDGCYSDDQSVGEMNRENSMDDEINTKNISERDLKFLEKRIVKRQKSNEKKEDKKEIAKEMILKLIEVTNSKKDKILTQDIYNLLNQHNIKNDIYTFTALKDLGIKKISSKINRFNAKFYTNVKLKNDVSLPTNSFDKYKFVKMDSQTLKSEILKYITITNNNKDILPVCQVTDLLIKRTLQDSKDIRKILREFGVSQMPQDKDGHRVMYYCGLNYKSL
jgi:prophage antirepressor-like protein